VIALADVQAAAARMAGQIVATPCLHSRPLSRLTGAEIHVKFENRQVTASFKERGALNRLLQLSAAERGRGVSTMSAGNHGQALAYHAGRLGIPALIVMPEHTPFVKIEQTRAHGAEVVLHGDTLAETGARAAELTAERRLFFVHPYDDEGVAAGQGTIALEMYAAQPDLEVLVVPVGGGGLLAGMATALRAVQPDVQIVGVQADSHPSMLAAIRGQDLPCGGSTIADGIAVKTAGVMTREVIRRLVDDIVLVDEAALEKAITLLLNVEKTVAEGAGAAAMAAVLTDPDRYRGRRTGIVLSGGNIDPRLLSSVVVRDLLRQNRIVSMRIPIPDRPGVLARISQAIGDLGANVLEVQHHRLSPALPARSATLELTFEARDARHGAAVIAAIRDAGFEPAILPP